MCPRAERSSTAIALVVVLASVAAATPKQFHFGTCSGTDGYVPAAFNESAATSRRLNQTLEQCCNGLSHKGTAVFSGSSENATTGTCYQLGNLDHSLLVPGDAGTHFVTLDKNDPSPRSTSDIAVACFVGLYVCVAIATAIVSMCCFGRAALDEQGSSTAVSGGRYESQTPLARPLLSLPGPVPKAPGTLDSRPAQSVQQHRQLPTGIDDAEIGAIGPGNHNRIGDGGFASGQHSLAGAVGRSSRDVDSTESEDGSDEAGVGAVDYRQASSARFDERSSSPGFQRSAEQGGGSSRDDGEASDTTFGHSVTNRRGGGGGAGGGRRGPKESHPLFDKRTGAEYTKKYRFIRKLGEGSSSDVYLVRLRASYAKRHAVSLANPGELMAMKVMECATDEELQAAFTEYMSMKRLQGHPNIVELLDMTMATEDLPPDVQALQVSGSPLLGGGRNSGNGGLPPRNFSTASSMDDMPPFSAESPARNDSTIVTPQLSKSPGYQASNSTESQQQQGSHHPASRGNRGMSRSRFSASSLSSFGGGEDGQSPTGFGRSRASAAARTAFTCLLMRFYPEGTLEGGVARDPAFFRRPSVVVTYTQQLLAALAFSHSHDIAHFDLKPANVLIQGDRRAVVVSDFGLARTMKRDDYANANAAAAAAAAGAQQHSADAEHDTGTEIGGGTLFFQAPEQLERRSSLRSDVWGAACTIIAMASGRVGAQTIPMFYWRAEADFHDMVRAAIADASLPPAFIELLLDMLAARPAERPRAEECLLRLATIVPDGLNVDTPAEELYAAAAAARRS